VPFDKLLGIDYGQCSGRSYDEVAREWPELSRQWWTEPHLVQFPGGGSLDVVRERAAKGLQEIVARHENEIVVLVSHNAVNKILICVMLGLENSSFWHVRQDTCCIDRFEYKNETFKVLTLNEVDHLPVRPPGLDSL
jgi:broad specificity phosphatase PhoE